ncbi:MAG: SAM-dependent methyltransferase [Microthrixaceae bacterium]
MGRGGEKLQAALERFELDPEGLRVLDAGASTGGFTDCLLQNGAAEVVALDVGHGQLDVRLRAHPSVTVIERTNLRHVSPRELGTFDAAVADLSFISLRLVMEVLLDHVRPGGWMVLLVKPRFECGRAEVSRTRGVVRDPQLWRGARRRDRLGDVTRRRHHGSHGLPLRGGDGNVEFLLEVAVAADEPDRAAPAGAGTTRQLVDRVLAEVPEQWRPV